MALKHNFNCLFAYVNRHTTKPTCCLHHDLWVLLHLWKIRLQHTPNSWSTLCQGLHTQWLHLFSLSKEKWILVLCSNNQGLQIVTFRQTPSHQTSELNESGEIWDIWTQGNWRITVYGEKPSTFCFSYFACEREKLLPLQDFSSSF